MENLVDITSEQLKVIFTISSTLFTQPSTVTHYQKDFSVIIGTRQVNKMLLMLKLKMEKPMKYLFQTIMLSMLLFVAASCNDDNEAVNTKGQVEFTMQGANSSHSTGRTMGNIEITSATAAITKVELEGENESENESTSEDSDENEIEFEGEYTVDLLAGTSDPAFGMAEVEAQYNNKIEVQFGNFLQDNASLIIEGTYTNDNGDQVPFQFSLKKAIELELESDTGFEVQVGSIKELVANIDFSLLFKNIDFSLAEANADGIVIINASLNTYVYNLISQNFEGSVELEVDDD